MNEKYQDMLEKNFKSTRTADLEPMFKPIHSKTMSLVGMLKQYATGGHASNEATERLFSPLKRGGGERVNAVMAPGADNARRTRRRSEDRGF